MPVEMVGGPHDGEELLPDHRHVFLSEILRFFDGPPSVQWAHDLDETTEISIEGKIKGHDLWLHVMEKPPEGTPATSTFDVNSGIFQDKQPQED